MIAAGLIKDPRSYSTIGKLGNRFWNVIRSDKSRRKALVRRRLLAHQLLRDVDATNKATLKLIKQSEGTSSSPGGDKVLDLARELSRYKQQGEHLVGDSQVILPGSGSFIRQLFVKYGGSGTAASTGRLEDSGMLPYHHLMLVCYNIFKYYSVDGTFLSKQEWIFMANLLGSDLHEYAEQCMTYDELLHWLRHLVVAIRMTRVKDRRRRRDAANLPPIAPIPLSVSYWATGIHSSKPDTEMKEESSEANVIPAFVTEPTSNAARGRARLTSKLQELDPLETGKISTIAAVHVCESIWEEYYPEGVRLDDDEVREARESLHSYTVKNKPKRPLRDNNDNDTYSGDITINSVKKWFKAIKLL